jgi:hypothetical protein
MGFFSLKVLREKTKDREDEDQSPSRLSSRLNEAADRRKRLTIVVIVASALILLNLITFLAAYPETFELDSGCCTTQVVAKDFSAFYTAGWRLLHDTANIYSKGNIADGFSSVIYPQPEQFKYLPSMLVLISPLTLLSYQNALSAFDLVQVALLGPIAFLIYKLLRSKSLAIITGGLIVAVVQPFPLNFPNWGLSVSYFWQWGEGQSKVLVLFLLLVSFYLGKTRRPLASGAVLGLSFFDPRFALASIPLFLFYNRAHLRDAGLGAISSFTVLNLPLFYPGVLQSYLQMILVTGLSTPLYPYAYIPLGTIVFLSIVNARGIWSTLVSLSLRVLEYLGEDSKAEKNRSELQVTVNSSSSQTLILKELHRQHQLR